MDTLIGQFPGRVLTPVALEITEHDFKGMQTYEPDTTVWGIGSKQLPSSPPPHFMRSCNHFLLGGVQWPEEGLNSSTPQQDVEQGQPSRLYPSPAFHYPAFDHKIEGEGLGTFIRTKSRQKVYPSTGVRETKSLLLIVQNSSQMVERVRNKSTEKNPEFSPPALVMA